MVILKEDSDLLSASPAGTSNRDPFLDSWRGIFHIVMVVDHLPFLLPGMFTLIAGLYEFLGYVTAAEGFVFLSGFVSGLVYTRVGREKGRRAMWWKALIRARNIYLCYVMAVILLLVLVKCMGPSQISWLAWNHLINEHLLTASAQVISLLVQPTFLEILPMYSLLLLVTPLLINQLENSRYLLVLIFSLLIWVAAQFNIRNVLLSLTGTHEVIHLGYFNCFAWQILFVIGLICGHKTYTANGPWLSRSWKLPLLAYLVALTFFLLRHDFLGINVNTRLVDRSCLGPLRLLDFFCVVFLLCKGRRQIEEYIAWKGFSFLSRNSLQVFAFHLLPIYFAALVVENKVPLPILTQLLVIIFCIASLFQIALFTQMFKGFDQTKQARTSLIYIYILYCFVFLFMLVEYLRGAQFSDPALQSTKESGINLILSKSSQLFVVISLFIWNVTLFWLRITSAALLKRQDRGWWGVQKLRDKIKLALIVLSFAFYIIKWGSAPQQGDSKSLLLGIDQSTNIIVFLTGILLNQIVENRLMKVKGERFLFSYISLTFIVIFLSTTSLIHPDSPYTYKYLTQTRWTGLWVNPNTYGLLMGLGVVLACGMVLLRTVWSWRLKAVLCTVAAGLMAIGLLYSYSRGAWLAAFGGLCYLGFQVTKMSDLSKRVSRWVRFNGLTVAVILCALALLTFWQFRDSEHKIARRTFSAGNVKDFSWRNRIMAWEGSLAMIAARPCLGFGWGMSEPMYDNYYQIAKVEGGMAVQLNDYFTIGTTLGLPALACFLWYVGLCFGINRQEQITPYDWLRTTCRAGAIVLLIGFWFDGGLFKMATAVMFWILIELGATELAQPKTPVP